MSFANRAAFLEPRRVVEPLAWAGHIPFAFWLVDALKPACIVELGTHTGNSFCAFAQAIEFFDVVGGRVFAVDHWMGDVHAGAYPDRVFEELSQYVGALYPDTAVMLRSSFDEALERFDDNSIDVLHIDGLHTYEAVRHDFETWLPKVKKDGVVLLHDTAVTSNGFGVAQLLQELAADYTTYNFSHSHGLGVVALGSVPAPLADLLANATDDAGLSASTVFSRLGNAILTRAHAEGFAATADAGHQAAKLAEIRAQIDVLASIMQREVELTSSLFSPYDNTGQGTDLLVRKMLASGYFSPAYYRTQIDAHGMSDKDLCLHYLRSGESGGLAPSEAFDVPYYAESNPDVAASDYGLLEHYVLFGRREGRSAAAGDLTDSESTGSIPTAKQSEPDIRS